VYKIIAGNFQPLNRVLCDEKSDWNKQTAVIKVSSILSLRVRRGVAAD
jgi:hypothetical protein